MLARRKILFRSLDPYPKKVKQACKFFICYIFINNSNNYLNYIYIIWEGVLWFAQNMFLIKWTRVRTEVAKKKEVCSTKRAYNQSSHINFETNIILIICNLTKYSDVFRPNVDSTNFSTVFSINCHSTKCAEALAEYWRNFNVLAKAIYGSISGELTKELLMIFVRKI